jgi:hypothetical protein
VEAAAMKPLHADIEEIKRTIRTLYPNSDVVELRVPQLGYDGTVSGYFTDYQKLAAAMAVRNHNGADTYNVYTTLNPVDPTLLSRANNRAKIRSKAHHPRQRHPAARVDLDRLRPGAARGYLLHRRREGGRI